MQIHMYVYILFFLVYALALSHACTCKHSHNTHLLLLWTPCPWLDVGKDLSAHTHTHTHSSSNCTTTCIIIYIRIDALFNQLTKKSTFASRKSRHDNISERCNGIRPYNKDGHTQFHAGTDRLYYIHFPSFFSNSLHMLYHLAIATLYFCISTHKHK